MSFVICILVVCYDPIKHRRAVIFMYGKLDYLVADVEGVGVGIRLIFYKW